MTAMVYGDSCLKQLHKGLLSKTTAAVVVAVSALTTQSLGAAVVDSAADATDQEEVKPHEETTTNATVLPTTTTTSADLHISPTHPLSSPSVATDTIAADLVRFNNLNFSSTGLSTTLVELDGLNITQSSPASLAGLMSTTPVGSWGVPEGPKLKIDPVIEWTSATMDFNVTEVPPGVPAGQSSAVGVAVGVSLVCLLLCVAVILIVCFIFRRKRAKRKEKSIVRVENPQYRMSLDRRTNTLENKSLSTAPTVNFQANSAKVILPEGTNGSQPRKKGEAPVAPIYRPSKDGGMLVMTEAHKKIAPERPPLPSDQAKRRPAPRTPTKVGPNLTKDSSTSSSSSSNSDIYEKDSTHGSMDHMEALDPGVSSVNNPAALVAPTKLSEPIRESTTPTKQLTTPTKQLTVPTRQKTTPTTHITPPSSPADNMEISSPSEPLLSVNQRQGPPKPSRITPRNTPPSSNLPSPKPRTSDNNNRESVGSAKRPESALDESARDEEEDVETALLGRMKNKKKVMGSNVSLDSYDRTLNPFFADDY